MFLLGDCLGAVVLLLARGRVAQEEVEDEDEGGHDAQRTEDDAVVNQLIRHVLGREQRQGTYDGEEDCTQAEQEFFLQNNLIIC